MQQQPPSLFDEPKTQESVKYQRILWAEAEAEALREVQKAGVEITRPDKSLFAENPNHPGIAHYIIHNYDNPVLAHKGLETARRYAKIAPSSSHAQHMPSHIFTRLGIWEESIQSNIQSAESARCYAQALGINEGFFEEIHAIDYLVYAYLQKGDNTRAEEQYSTINAATAVHPLNVTAVMYPIAAVPSRLALENKNWKTRFTFRTVLYLPIASVIYITGFSVHIETISRHPIELWINLLSIIINAKFNLNSCGHIQ